MEKNYIKMINDIKKTTDLPYEEIKQALAESQWERDKALVLLKKRFHYINKSEQTRKKEKIIKRYCLSILFLMDLEILNVLKRFYSSG